MSPSVLAPLATDSPVLAFLALLGACVWIGGFVAVGVVARVARRTLHEADRVAFFRALGREYGVVSSIALLVAFVSGGALLADRAWDGAVLAAVVLAAAVVLTTGLGVAQARGMTGLRERAVRSPDDATLTERVRRGARRATALRALIGLLSLGLLAVAAALAT